MNTSRTGAKKRAGEQPVVAHLIERGYHRAYAMGPQGVNDKGDVGGIDGVCIEVKNHGRYNIPGWLKELAREKLVAAAGIGALIVKPNGYGPAKIGQWWAVMPFDDFITLLDRAGCGPKEIAHDVAGPRDPVGDPVRQVGD